MATTVRVRDDDKALLDALQARYTLASGSRIPLDELLHRILEIAEAHEDELILDDTPPRLAAKDVRAFLGSSSDWGPGTTTEEDLDRALYDGEDAA